MYIQAKKDEEKTVQIDGTWHEVIYPAVRFFDNINAGDEVEVRFDKDKNITFIKTIGTKKETEEKIPENKDPYRPLGNLYAMCEEKLNAVLEQNSINNSLLFEIAKKLGVEMDFKPASEKIDTKKMIENEEKTNDKN